MEDVQEIISKYANLGKIDVLITHEAPKHELISRDETILGYDIFDKVLKWASNT